MKLVKFVFMFILTLNIYEPMEYSALLRSYVTWKPLESRSIRNILHGTEKTICQFLYINDLGTLWETLYYGGRMRWMLLCGQHSGKDCSIT